MTSTSGRDFDAERLVQVAQRLLANGDVGDGYLRERAAVDRPLPVVDDAGATHSWFVPVGVGDRLAGWFRFTPFGDLMGYHSFPSRGGRFDECPLRADWLDTTAIAARADELRRPEETADAPVLSFDGVPDRLAWAVRLRRPDGAIRTVFVIGRFAYASRLGGGIG